MPELAEQEINLRDYINVINKRKKLILSVFFISVVTTAICSLLMPKIYKAIALIMITPSRIQSAISSSQISLEAEKSVNTGLYVGQKPIISLPTHKELLNSSVVLERLINRLKLTDQTGKYLTPPELSNKLDIKDTKETNILQLMAEDKNPKIAREIVNTWAQEYIIYSQELISGEVKGTGEFITDQFEIAKDNLFRAEERVKDFKDKYKIDLMRAELNIKKAKLNDYKKELLELGTAIKTKEDNLAELKKAIASQERFIIVSKSITDDALWQNEGKAKSTGNFDRKKLRSEEINPIYQDLETRIVNSEIDINTMKPRLDYLVKSVGSSESEIKELEKNINQREFELIQLSRQVDIYKKTYDNLSSKNEEARITKAAQLGEVRLISPALEPQRPIKPNRRLNVAIAGMVSLVCGTLLAFFMEYWSKLK